jgi:hypothetical protein
LKKESLKKIVQRHNPLTHRPDQAIGRYFSQIFNPGCHFLAPGFFVFPNTIVTVFGKKTRLVVVSLPRLTDKHPTIIVRLDCVIYSFQKIRSNEKTFIVDYPTPCRFYVFFCR